VTLKLTVRSDIIRIENQDSMKRKAFTLIEVLVVIAIIAILMAILLPALNKAREQGQRAACKSNLKNYALGVYMYTIDYDDRFFDPYSCYFSQPTPYPVEGGLSRPRLMRWCNGDLYLREHPEYAGPFYPYLQEARSFICPTFSRIAFENFEDPVQPDVGKIRNYKPWYNYTMNAYLGSSQNHVKKSRVMKLSEVKHLAETFSFTEESTFFDPQYSISGINDTYMIPGTDDMIRKWLDQAGSHQLIKAGPYGVGQLWNVIAGFHHAPSGDPLGGKGNCAFLDGHVDAYPREETFLLAWPH
jgi:prepilin-type N-terminal cleavage/methylation domain-containing protein/prepilin-type processing-associated H-X9-DG protein